MGSMNYPKLLSYNLIGGLRWGAGMSFAGYFFGQLLPADKVDKYLLPVIFLIIVISLLPSVIHVWRESGDDIVAWMRRRTAGQRA
jgi:membrane-associated protein